VIGIVYIVSDFVVAVFPKVTAKLVGVWLRTESLFSHLSTTRELERGIAPKFFLRKIAVSPVQVAGIDRRGANDDMRSSTPLSPTRVVPMNSPMITPQVEAGCMDHNHDIVGCGSHPRDGKDQGFDQCKETQWNGNLKQNLDRSAVSLRVEENIPVKRIDRSFLMARKLTSI
jgi:hypothetical protein